MCGCVCLSGSAGTGDSGFGVMEVFENDFYTLSVILDVFPRIEKMCCGMVSLNYFEDPP